jgi:hypothetical protein
MIYNKDINNELSNDEEEEDIATLRRKILKGNALSPDGKADDNNDIEIEDDDVDPYNVAANDQAYL